MHFQCKQENLLSAVNLIEKAVATQTTLPILTGIHLKTKNNNLILTSTNLEMSIRTQIEIHSTVEGSVVINGKLFAAMVKKLPNEPIIFEKKNNQLIISAATIEFTLNIYNEEDFPQLPEPESEILTITGKELNRLIKNTIFSTVKDEIRPYLNGILFELEKNTLNLVATDSNRLAFINGDINENFTDKLRIIIPAKVLLELNRSLPHDDSIIKLSFGNKQVIFNFDQNIIISRLIDAEFPNYRSLFPDKQPTQIVVKVQALMNAIERASLLNTGDIQAVIFDVTEGVLEIKTPSSEIGTICEQLNVEHQGDNCQAAYSTRYILDMLKATEEDHIRFEFNSDFRQAVFKPIENNRQMYILMPLRLN